MCAYLTNDGGGHCYYHTDSDLLQEVSLKGLKELIARKQSFLRKCEYERKRDPHPGVLIDAEMRAANGVTQSPSQAATSRLGDRARRVGGGGVTTSRGATYLPPIDLESAKKWRAVRDLNPRPSDP
jgi:hypothetical protein